MTRIFTNIREPQNGINYYADASHIYANAYGHRYKLIVWRKTLGESRRYAEILRGDFNRGCRVIVRKIAFHKGGMFRKNKGPHTIYRYGVYARAVKV